jgi:hypothetical protein
VDLFEEDKLDDEVAGAGKKGIRFIVEDTTDAGSMPNAHPII